MRRSFFIAGILSLLLVTGAFLAGCTQYPGSSPAQPAGTTGAPVQTPEQPTPEITQGQFGTGGQAGISTEAGTSQRTYVVAMTAYREGLSTILLTYQGGQDSAYLQYITVTANGQAEGKMQPAAGQGSLPVGTQEKVSATQPCLIVATGHFSDGTDQVLFDTPV